MLHFQNDHSLNVYGGYHLALIIDYRVIVPAEITDTMLDLKSFSFCLYNYD